MSLQLSIQVWIVNSGSIGVNRTSMCRYNRSVATSQAQCMFWLLTALKGDLFLERIWECFFRYSKVVFELDPFDTKTFSNLRAEILVKWIAP